MEKNTIYNFTTAKIARILGTRDEGAQKAELAELRRGVGKEPGELPVLWGAFLEGMPEEMLSVSGEASHAEWSIYTALTLFALHQQGHDPDKEPMHRKENSFGKAVYGLVAASNPKGKEEEDSVKARILRRFNMVATSPERTEMAHHLRGMIQLLSAASIPLDYGRLAEDLYWYQFPKSRTKVRLHWGQDFYMYMHRKEDNNE